MPLIKDHPRYRGLLFFIEVAAVSFFYRRLDKLTYAALLKLGLISPITPGVAPSIGTIALITAISLLFVACALWLSQAIRGGRFSDYNLKWPASPFKTVLWTLVGGIVLQGIVGQVLMPVLERLFHSEASVPAVPDLYSLLGAIALSFIAGGLREELFFRAYLISRIKAAVGNPKWGTAAGVIFQIIFFSYLHAYQGPVGIIATGVSAIAFTAAFLVTGNLFTAIMLHAFYDTAGFMLLYCGFK